MYAKYIKRMIDILLSIIGLPVFLVFYLIFGSIIKMTDKGPVFYEAERIGKDFRLYKMYKFRSMKVNVPMILNQDGSTYNAKDDPRVTKIGKIMRETSIDEIPQVLNVLKGEMSIIGPRASLSIDLETFEEDEKDKMKVRPGITGYSQAYYRNSRGSREKRLKDAWYANNVSLILDSKILFRTIITVFTREGLYTNEDENTEAHKEQ